MMSGKYEMCVHVCYTNKNGHVCACARVCYTNKKNGCVCVTQINKWTCVCVCVTQIKKWTCVCYTNKNGVGVTQIKMEWTIHK